MGKKLIIFFSVLSIFFMAIYFHTNTLEVTHHQRKIGNGIQHLKIAHISDLHTKGMGKLELQLINALKEVKPDVIVMTGDLATPSGTLEGYSEVLHKLKAPKGVFFVQGNWEYWEPIEGLKQTLQKSGVVDLTNQTREIDKDLWLVGFDDSLAGTPQLDILKSIPTNVVKVGIFHSPSFFGKTSGLVELSLAGHSHGGQIRLPLVGALWLPPDTGPYELGWYKKDNSHLFVSKGIGTSILPIRFFCSPELAIIDVSY